MRLFSPRAHALVGVSVATAAALLLRSHPLLSWRCPFHELLGVACPGCGGTRALAALLNGQWGEAVDQNLLIVALAPLAAIWAAWHVYSAVRWDRWRPVRASNTTVVVLILSAGLFTLARNLYFP